MGNFALLFFLASLPLLASGYTPSNKYLKNYCGSAVKFTKDLVLQFSSGNIDFDKNYRCAVSFSTSDSSRFIQLRFIDIDLKKTDACHSAGIIIKDSNGMNLTPSFGVCGTRRPITLYRTTGNMASVTLVTDNTSNNWGDFKILLTAFDSRSLITNYTCHDSDFRCDNGLCVSDDVTCNGYNDCGDSSDEVEGCGLVAGAIVGIVFGCLVFCFLCAFLGLCVRRRRIRYVRITETARPYQAINTTTSGYAPTYTQYQ